MFGKHFLLGLRPTLDLDPADRRLLSTIKPAGVIVFRGNFEANVPYEQWHRRFASLIESVREAIGRDEILIGIDHEGGTVLRPPRPITPFGFARRWADRAEAVGRAMGIELASLGINLDFAPVVDIDSNPANPVIGPRAFGTTADEVIAAAKPFLAALQAEGVLGCPKHFPGHGDTSTDSHLELPVQDADREALRARELRPFASLIGPDVHVIMTAHILFPALDPVRPATMSPAIVRDILRDELGYQGVVITDDIGMRAVSKLFDKPGACAEVLASGSDMIMVCSHWTSTDRAYELVADLERSYKSGELSDAVVSASAQRIDALLARAPRHVPRLLPASVFAAHETLAPLQVRAGAVGQTVSLEEKA